MVAELLFAICGVGGGVGTGFWAVPALFLAGLLGGAGHCSVMCGPFVLAQVADRFATGVTDRFSAALLLPYQAGRIATYTLLGAIAGGFGGAFTWLAAAPWLAPGALLVGAAAFAFRGLGALGFSGPQWMIGRIARGLGGGRGLGLGLALGFLPCGLVYAALIAAVGAGGAVQGGLALAGFGIGTVPALAAVGWLGLAAGRRWLELVRAAAPVISLANAVILAALAYSVA